MSREDEGLTRLTSTLEAVQAKLDDLAAVLEAFDPDRLGQTRALAEDGLARADHALAVAGDALAQAESSGADALARADHATKVAGDAVARADSQGADALARADHAKEVAGDAVARAESLGADALGRAEHALAVAGDAVAMARSAAADTVARAESLGADATARADHALAHAADAKTLAEDARAHAETAAATSEFAAQAAREALLPARMAAFSAWLELRPRAAETTISIVLPTRDRPALLPRAVDSVLAQSYGRWQLVVVDDGETDAVATTLAGIDDERAIMIEGPRRGLGAARNAGLDVATGEIVCYLDDDNVLHRGWLEAVAHVFGARPDVDVLYGVTIAEHRRPDAVDGDDWWPAFWQLPFSHETLLRENPTDAGAMAHRRDLPEARFDEAMGEDWDLLIRLTADRPALAVPAVSHAYALSGDDHMSNNEAHRAALDAVRRRHSPDARR
jgi:hypothetical protein